MAAARKKRRPPSLPQFALNKQSDRGAVGLAMLSRPCVVEKAATGSMAIGREQADRLKYQDAHLVDRMQRAAQLSDRQHEAATKFLEMWTAAAVEPSVVASYGERTGIHEPPAECDGNPSATDVYRRFVRPFRGKAPLTAHKLEIVEGVMQGKHPGVMWLATAQAAFDDLANWWNITDE